MTKHVWFALALAACAANPTSMDPGGDPPPPPPADPQPGSVQLTLDSLQAGWRVTTAHLTAGGPSETTIVSDGSPITLTGTADDVVAATVTDANGALVSTHAMGAPCTMASAHRLDVPAQYATIQQAIDAASPGDTVKVAPGQYTESVKLRPGVCLVGSGARKTTLDARGETRTLVDLSEAPGSVVAGFTLRGVSSNAGCASSDVFACSGDWYRAAVYLGGLTWDDPVRYAPPLVVNNIFEDDEIALMLYWHGVAIVRNNIFVSNQSALVANHFQDKAFVANNVFADNAELAIGNQAAYLDIIDNVIAGSRVGIHFEYVQTGKIRCNLFAANGANQEDVNLAPPRFTIGTDGNVQIDPDFVGPSDYHLAPGSPAVDAGCDRDTASEPDGSPIDIGAYGGPLARWVEL
ncbi:MAG TPA: right-handed parallel beta-helix repeat-containing protein [Kofleriaceae bacterium]|nr:right-handed parallel beta-helix repeat-containing protein [Kofleriaceae bacterium]